MKTNNRNAGADASRTTWVLAVVGALLLTVSGSAQTTTILKHFGGSDGRYPWCVLTLSSNVIYGTTVVGGNSNNGAVFRMNTDGTDYTVLKHFHPSDGINPHVGVTLFSNVLYGTTFAGGVSNQGTVFRINTDGSGYAVLKHFSGGLGYPEAPVTVVGDQIYGTTTWVGGSLFSMDTNGSNFTVLKNFNYEMDPRGTLTISGDTIYGTASAGGLHDSGAVFKISTDGSGYQVLGWFLFNHSGDSPMAGMVLKGDTLYGTTRFGGGSDNWKGGTVFQIKTNGTFPMALRYFGDEDDGAEPLSDLVLVGDTLYGTTSLSQGASSGNGSIFKIKTDGSGYGVVDDYTPVVAGSCWAGLVFADGALYGISYDGGSNQFGAIFKEDLNNVAPVPLKAAQPSASQLVLTWTNSWFSLQAATNIAGPFTNVPNGQSPYTNVMSGAQGFFRLTD